MQLPSNELGLLVPAYDDEALIELFGIQPDDRVLDVGGGAQPFARADVVVELHLHDNSHRGGAAAEWDQRLVQASVEDLPFRDGAFDVVICRHVLEHVDNPAKACAELTRVGRRGFLETPSPVNELMHGYPNHVWMVDRQGPGLHFAPKPFARNPFGNITRALHYADAEFRERFEGTYRNVFCTQLAWDAPFPVSVEPRGPEHFDYSDPVQASVAHLDYALNYLAHGLDGTVPAEVEEHLRVAAAMGGPDGVAAHLLTLFIRRDELAPGALSQHVDALRAVDLVAAVRATRHRAAPFVITGCGRSGTGYTAQLLRALGVDCGHEDQFQLDEHVQERPSDSSWLAVPHLHDLPQGTRIVHQVRDPLAFIRSCLAVGLFRDDADPYNRFLFRHAPQIFVHDTEIGRAMAWWVHWNRRVESAASLLGLDLLRLRIEDVDTVWVDQLLDHLGATTETDIDEALSSVPTDYNHRGSGPPVDWDDLPPGRDRDLLAAMARRYGYQAPETPTAVEEPDAGLVASVIVRTCDRPDRLDRALASLATNERPDVEVIVVDDGSAVDISGLVERWRGPLHIHLVRHDANKGRSAALNSGLRAATTNRISILDDDDVAWPWHLDTLLGAAAVHGPESVVHVQALRAETRSDGTVERVLEQQGPATRDRMLVANRLPIQAVSFPRRLALDVGGVDEQLDVCEDWDFWLRLGEHADFVEHASVTSEYRVELEADNTFQRHPSRHFFGTEEVFRRHPSDDPNVAQGRDARLVEMLPLLRIPTVPASVVIAHADGDVGAAVAAARRAFAPNDVELLVQHPERVALPHGAILLRQADGVAAAFRVGGRRASGRVVIRCTDMDRLTRLDGYTAQALPPGPVDLTELRAQAERDLPLSIVLPVHNAVELTQQTLTSVAEHTPEGGFEVILVDNASTDATTLLLWCLEGDVQVVTNPSNRGVVGGWNDGAVRARGERVVFLQQGDMVTSGWTRRLDSPSAGDPVALPREVVMTEPFDESLPPPRALAVLA